MLCAAPLVKFVSQTVVVYIPTGKFVAVALTLTMTVDCPPATNVPAVEETLSQREVLTKVQFKADVPVLVKKYGWLAGLNGPLIGPLLTKPVDTVMLNGSGLKVNETGAELLPFATTTRE